MATGRPMCPVNKEQIEFLRNSGLKLSSITKVLGISRSTLYKRLSLFGLADEKRDFSNQEIDDVLLPILNELPNFGEVYIMGILRARHIRIPRQRLRDRLSALDSHGRVARRKNTIKRRVYKVNGPNCLW